MKIATWNVNGIRARQASCRNGSSASSPTSSACRRSRRRPTSCRLRCARWRATGATGTASKGYSGVALHVSKALAPSGRPSRIRRSTTRTASSPSGCGDLTVASVYVPNGGKDFPAKMRFLDALEQFVAELAREPQPLVICGDLNIARTDIDVHPKERKPRAIGQLPEERALLERIIGHGLVDVGRALEPDNDRLFTWWAPWRNMRQRNIGWRLDYVLASRGALRPRAQLRGRSARSAPATTRRWRRRSFKVHVDGAPSSESAEC